MSETWVDKQTVEIPHPGTWGTLNLNQLLEVKNQIMSKIYMAGNNQMYLKPLNTALANVDVLIAKKLSDPRGSS